MQTVLLWALAGAAWAALFFLLKGLLFLTKCLRAHRKFAASPIPGPPTSRKILGHIPDIYGPKGIWVMAQWAQQYGPLYKVHFLDECVLVCTDPDANARITRRTGPGPYFPKPHAFYESLESAIQPPMANLLTVDDGDYHKAVRGGAAPCFSASNMKKVLPLVLELTQRVVDRMHACHQHQQLVDVTDGAKRITSDIMGHLLLGEDLGGTRWEPSEYLELFFPVLRAQGELMNNPYHMWCLWRADVRHARTCITRHNALMDKKVTRLIKDPPPEHTIAAHLLKVVDPATGKRLTPNQLKAEIAIFMAAGFETTSHGITWSLSLLAAYPEVQEELVQELVAAGIAPAADGSSPGRDFQASDLGRLPLLGAIIKEALRVCPPAPFGGSRFCPVDGAELCGYKVDKGTVVMIAALPIALASHTFGADAGEFRPNRWLSSSSTTADGSAGKEAAAASPTGSDDTTMQRDTSAAAAGSGAGPKVAAAAAAAGSVQGSTLPDPLTFMSGPRDCIGQNLAKLELQVVLATLLSQFKYSPGPELQRELDVAAATGQPRVAALHALAGVHVTLQPQSRSLELRVEPRVAAVPQAS